METQTSTTEPSITVIAESELPYYHISPIPLKPFGMDAIFAAQRDKYLVGLWDAMTTAVQRTKDTKAIQLGCRCAFEEGFARGALWLHGNVAARLSTRLVVIGLLWLLLDYLVDKIPAGVWLVGEGDALRSLLDLGFPFGLWLIGIAIASPLFPPVRRFLVGTY